MATINLGRVVGRDGRGIISILKTNTVGLVDTYTITYTDNTTDTFSVRNGADGSNGTSSSGAGLTLEQISALDEMFQKCVFTEDATAAYANFKLAFGIQSGEDYEPDSPQPNMYTITQNLNNCTSSNSTTFAEENSSYTATIVAGSGYTLEGATVSVTMGGTNINSSYSSGVISIAKVTGNIVINISAVLVQTEPEPDTPVDPEPEEPSDPTAAVYSLASPTTFDGATSVDTGYIINDIDKDYTIMIDYNPTSSSGFVFDNSKNNNLFGPRINLSDNTL